MAGDWIKVEHATLNKPEVLMAAELLNVSRREALGIFLDYWAWLDVNLRESCNGCVTHVYGKLFEQALQCPGLVAVLDAIGWAKYDPSSHTLTIIHHERHNGNTAKSRALTRDRVKRLRNDSVTPTPLPEKRREEKREDQEREANAAIAAHSPANGKRKIATAIGEQWEAPEQFLDYAVKVYRIDRQRAARISLAFKDWHLKAPGSRGLSKDWGASWRMWLRKEFKDA